MSEYRRLISYIYEYEGKEKGKNVGYVKLEAKNGQCRLNVNVKRIYVGGNAIGVYLLSKTGEQILLGNMFVRGGGGEFRAVVDAKNVEGTGIGLDGYYGLTVHDIKNEWRSYKTVWDDVILPALPDEIPLKEPPKTAAPEHSSEEEGPEVVAEMVMPEHSSEEEEPEVVAETVMPEQASEEEGPEVVAETVMPEQASEKEEPETVSEDSQEVCASEMPSETDVSEAPAMSPELENPELLQYLLKTETLAADPELLWQELRKVYPKIQPFDYDGDSEVLTIRPQDIGKLPRENWVYGNNSFLLHGYYNFRYLILIRLKHSDGKMRYLIGIPGHYYSSEKYMAAMFGFPNFVLSKKQPPNDDRFGYWYTDIKMN